MNVISGVKTYLSVIDGEDLGLDGVIGNGHCRRGRAILTGTRDQKSDYKSSWTTQRGVGPDGRVDSLCVAVIDDDSSLITTPAVVVPPLKKHKPDQQKFHIIRLTCSPDRRSGTRVRKDIPNSREYTFHRIPLCNHNHSPFESIRHRRKTNTASVGGRTTTQRGEGCIEMAGRHKRVFPSQLAEPRTSSNPSCLDTKESGCCSSTSQDSEPSGLPKGSEPWRSSRPREQR